MIAIRFRLHIAITISHVSTRILRDALLQARGLWLEQDFDRSVPVHGHVYCLNVFVILINI